MVTFRLMINIFYDLDAKSEDDGILLSIVFDGNLKQSYLLLLDGVTLKTVAVSYLPYNVPWSAHGMHFPEADFRHQVLYLINLYLIYLMKNEYTWCY